MADQDLPADFFGDGSGSGSESSEESDSEYWGPPHHMAHHMAPHAMPGPSHAMPGPSPFYPPPQGFYHPQGFHYYSVPAGLPGTGYVPDGPIASVGGQEFSEGRSQADPLAEHLLNTTEVGRKLLDSGGEGNKLKTNSLSVSYQDFENKLFNGFPLLQEVTGPSVGAELASTVAQIWDKGRAPKVVKKIKEEYLRPENVAIKKTVLNDMIANNIGKSYRAKDNQALHIQGDLVAAAMPLVALVEGTKKKDIGPDKVCQMAFSSLSLISAANAQLNQMRRDTLKPALNSRYRAICADPVRSSETLFGDDLHHRCEQAQTAAALAQKITASSSSSRGRGQGNRGRGGRGRYEPYPTYGLYGAHGHYGYPGGRGGKKKSRGKTKSHYEAFIRDTDFSFESETNFSSEIEKENIDKADVDALLFRTEGKQVPQEIDQLQLQQGEERVDPAASEEVMEEVSYGKIPMDMWGDKFEAGRVALCEDYWSTLTSDPVILQYVRGVELEFDDLPEQRAPMPEVRFSAKERQFVKEEILNLLEKKVISKVDHVEGEFISNIFIVEKSEPGKYRMILNLKRLNKYLVKSHFKMDSLASAIALIVPGTQFHSFDFSDAYYSIRVAPNHRKYLRFYFEGQLYEYSVIANGVSSGPRIFTKLMRVCLAYLRKEHDISVSGFLDDQILCHYNGTKDAMQKGRIAAIHFQKCGFTISMPKSVADPGVTRIAHLGFVLDSMTMRAYMTEKKTEKLLGAIESCLRKDRITIRELASLKGRIEATGFANPHAKLFSKRLEIQKTEALRSKGFDYEASLVLVDECREDLEAVRRLLPGVSAPLRIPPPDEVLKSDSSGKGWGIFRPQSGARGGGQWTEEEKTDHINVLELKACLFALKSFCAKRSNEHIRLVTDNSCAMYCIRRQGSSKVRLNDVAREIWLFAMERNLMLSSAHLAGKLNVESDQESRVFDVNTEWSLKQDIYQEIIGLFGKPSIDLFASRLNHKTVRYCSWKPDPGAEVIDGFMLDSWADEFVYAFPPFALIHRFVQRCIQDEAEGILICPVWITQPWFNLVRKIMIGRPFLFTVTKDELFLPFSSRIKVHPLAPLKMQAIRVSGALVAC